MGLTPAGGSVIDGPKCARGRISLVLGKTSWRKETTAAEKLRVHRAIQRGGQKGSRAGACPPQLTPLLGFLLSTSTGECHPTHIDTSLTPYVTVQRQKMVACGHELGGEAEGH